MSADGDEHSLTEIARLTCMPVSTTHRLVTELAGWGLLERTDESQFRVGGSIRAIGSRVSYSPRIIELARRVLDDLAATVRTSARLGVLAGTQVAYIERRCDHRPVTTFAHAPRLPRARNRSRQGASGVFLRGAAQLPHRRGPDALYTAHANRSRGAAAVLGSHQADASRGFTR